LVPLAPDGPVLGAPQQGGEEFPPRQPGLAIEDAPWHGAPSAGPAWALRPARGQSNTGTLLRRARRARASVRKAEALAAGKDSGSEVHVVEIDSNGEEVASPQTKRSREEAGEEEGSNESNDLFDHTGRLIEVSPRGASPSLSEKPSPSSDLEVRLVPASSGSGGCSGGSCQEPYRFGTAGRPVSGEPSSASAGRVGEAHAKAHAKQVRADWKDFAAAEAAAP
jgi:hypothetical protein